jgi:hypothetical protein
MIAVISFICRPSVLLPAPGNGPALTRYQEAGQVPGGWLSHWRGVFFGKKTPFSDSKTGRAICLQNMQNAAFAYFLSEKEAEF